MITRSSIGSIAEIKVASKFIEYGMTVFFPFNDNSRIDMIAEHDGNVYRIQVKSSSMCTEENSMMYRLEHNGLYDDTQIDYFVFYNNITGSICMIHVNDAVVKGKMSISLRTDTPKTNQVRKVNYEKDYLIDDVIVRDFRLRKLTAEDSKTTCIKKAERSVHSKAVVKKPEKEVLYNELKIAKTVQEVSDKYNVTTYTLRKWCKDYGFAPEDCGASRWINRKVGEDALVEKVCPTCGKHFKAKPKAVYCSHECNSHKRWKAIYNDKEKIIDMFVNQHMRPYKIAEILHHDSDVIKKILIENDINVD